ncbi:MAG: hypothetical protein V9G19_06800 [Tetrasphaera sp.]
MKYVRKLAVITVSLGTIPLAAPAAYPAATPASGVSAAATTTVRVSPGNRRGWTSVAFDAATNADLKSTQSLVKGPGRPALGIGSLRYAIGDNSNRVEQFRTARYDGKRLASVTALKYSTWQRSVDGANPQQPVYLRLNIDYTGDNVMDEQLYYIPANNGTVLQRTWQTWNAFTGIWGINGDDGPQNDVTLTQYLAAHPNAKLVNNGPGGAAGGAVDFQVGAAGANQQNGRFFLDAVTIGFSGNTTIFNLEPAT